MPNFLQTPRQIIILQFRHNHFLQHPSDLIGTILMSVRPSLEGTTDIQ
jgi:hypothetical protein